MPHRKGVRNDEGDVAMKFGSMPLRLRPRRGSAQSRGHDGSVHPAAVVTAGPGHPSDHSMRVVPGRSRTTEGGQRDPALGRLNSDRALSRPGLGGRGFQPHGRVHARRRRGRRSDHPAGRGRSQLPQGAPALPEAVGLPRRRGHQRFLVARCRLPPPGRSGHPRLRPERRDLRGPVEDPAPQHGAGDRLLRSGFQQRQDQPAQPRGRRRHRQAVLLRRARGPGASGPAPRQRARPRRLSTTANS